jgi:hypothetical protein
LKTWIGRQKAAANTGNDHCLLEHNRRPCLEPQTPAQLVGKQCVPSLFCIEPPIAHRENPLFRCQALVTVIILYPVSNPLGDEHNFRLPAAFRILDEFNPIFVFHDAAITETSNNDDSLAKIGICDHIVHQQFASKPLDSKWMMTEYEQWTLVALDKNV